MRSSDSEEGGGDDNSCSILTYIIHPLMYVETLIRRDWFYVILNPLNINRDIQYRTHYYCITIVDN